MMKLTVELKSPPFSRPQSVLLVNDDLDECAFVSKVLDTHGLCVEVVHDGARGLARALKGGFDLVILASALPVLDGLGVSHEIRMRNSVRILMLASPGDDCLGILDAGADDFVVRPFNMPELQARVHAVLRRSAGIVPARGCIGSSGDLFLNLETHEAWLSGHKLQLTNVEFAILKCLVRSPGRIVSRDELAAVLYQRESTPFERTIDVHISHVRKKIERVGRNAIRTIRGVGYLFTPLSLGPEVNATQANGFSCTKQ